jgi:hypothetical protein
LSQFPILLAFIRIAPFLSSSSSSSESAAIICNKKPRDYSSSLVKHPTPDEEIELDEVNGIF